VEDRAARVLVVDDEDNIAFLVRSALVADGHRTDTAGSGAQALERVKVFRPDLVILDVMLPDINGFDLLPRLRSGAAPMPVIFLTARDLAEDRVRGLTIGGDDYVVKPFSVEELLARVRIALRHSGFAGRSAILRCADLELDDERHQVRRGEREIHLSPTEYKLLRYLLANAGRVLSKAQILDHVWEYDFGGDGSAVENYISYLRRKVDAHGPRLIQTLRGVGYTIRPGIAEP
jgi:two-component system OmpR family response regulator